MSQNRKKIPRLHEVDENPSIRIFFYSLIEIIQDPLYRFICIFLLSVLYHRRVFQRLITFTLSMENNFQHAFRHLKRLFSLMANMKRTGVRIVK